MPSQILHVLLARQACSLSGLGGDSPLSAALYFPQPFNIGCQGPDIFAHNRRTKPFALAYARLLHRRDYGRFAAECAREYLIRPDAVLAGWLTGFLTHQIVDRIFHPYIVYRSASMQPSVLGGITPALQHAFLERILDVCMLRTVSGQSVHSFDTGDSFFLEPSLIRLLEGPIARSLLRTFPAEAVSDRGITQRVGNAFSDAVYFHQLTNPSAT